jgi:hypothetical protein
MIPESGARAPQPAPEIPYFEIRVIRVIRG